MKQRRRLFEYLFLTLGPKWLHYVQRTTHTQYMMITDAQASDKQINVLQFVCHCGVVAELISVYIYLPLWCISTAHIRLYLPAFVV